MALTDSKIKQAKPEGKDYKLTDGKGLFLLVAKSGSKYWRMKYRIAGKEKQLAIGVYPTVTLKEARKAREAAKDLLEQGIDPTQAKKTKKIERALAQANNLEAIGREWLERQGKIWSEKYTAKVMRSLEVNLFPFLGTLPIDQITPILPPTAFKHRVSSFSCPLIIIKKGDER